MPLQSSVLLVIKEYKIGRVKKMKGSVASYSAETASLKCLHGSSWDRADVRSEGRAFKSSTVALYYSVSLLLV